MSFQAAQKVRNKLAKQKHENEKAEEKKIEKLVEDTSRSSAANAMRLGKLLKKKWFEYEDQFVIRPSI